MNNKFKPIAIVGVGEADLPIEGRSIMQIQAEAAKKAILDSGIDKNEIDGIFCAGVDVRMPSMYIAEYLGLKNIRYGDATRIGGSSFEAHLLHAAAAINQGLCQVGIILYASTQKSDSRVPNKGYRFIEQPFFEWERPYAVLDPLSSYALAAQRHMDLYGTTKEQLAEIAVATRKWAMLNPRALKREPLTLEEVMTSRVVSSPLRLLDCCLVTDGAGAIVVMSEEYARKLNANSVFMLGGAEAYGHNSLTQAREITETAAVITGKRALDLAGMTVQEMDIVQLYDSFTITVLLLLEDLGFCKKGEGGQFVENQRTAPGGDFALNTSGGGLSYCHPGMFGIFLIIEAVKQLRQQCGERQVQQAKTAMVHGVGGKLSSHSTVILAV